MFNPDNENWQQYTEIFGSFFLADKVIDMFSLVSVAVEPLFSGRLSYASINLEIHLAK